MADQNESLFRKESLERLSSPERLDQLIQVVKPKEWLPLAALGALVVLAVVWSIFGRIPFTVSGRGVLIRPRQPSSSPLVSLAYFTIGDGKQIQPGMKIMITPDTVKREEYGGVLGSVTSVSSLPVTKQSAANLIGNAEVAETLISQSGQMQVIAQPNLNPSTFSGYEWSSARGSPHQKLTPGTTTSVRVILEEKAPITFVFPVLGTP